RLPRPQPRARATTLRRRAQALPTRLRPRTRQRPLERRGAQSRGRTNHPLAMRFGIGREEVATENLTGMDRIDRMKALTDCRFEISNLKLLSCPSLSILSTVIRR